MNDSVRIAGEGPHGIGFLDIAVKGVIHGANVRMPDCINMSSKVVHCVDEITLEAVQRLERNGDTALGGMIADRALRGDGPPQFRGGGPGTGELA